MNVEVFEKLGDKFFLRLLVDVISIIVLIRFVYFRMYRKKDFFFTFFMFNITIFIITYLMNKVEMSFGAAFGLFAVFSLLRYRTENISEKDMTYLFIVIAIGLITASIKGTYFESAFINFIIIAFAFFLDGNLLVKNELVQIVQYENIENIKPQNSELLLADLKERTGLDIHKVSIQNIDFLKDTAEMKIYYYETRKKN
jgi:hypothetical protein